MKLNRKKRLLDNLAREVETPEEFIDAVMALQGQTPQDVADASGITRAYFYVILSGLRQNTSSIGVATIVKIAKGLDIDPYALNRVVSDYKLRVYLKTLE